MGDVPLPVVSADINPAAVEPAERAHTEPGRAAPDHPESRQPDVLRVMTWNVKDLHGDPEAVIGIIRAAGPDVLCLQEAPRLLFTRNQLAELARRCGLFFADGGRIGAGTAILTSLRTELSAARGHRLPVQGWRTRPRGFVRATIALPGTRAVSVTSLHLGLDPDQRADHVERLLKGLTDDIPAILAGDMNERPDGSSWRALQDWGRDPDAKAPNTFRAKRPHCRIDVILVDPRLDVLTYGDPPALDEADLVRASDHRPVFAEVRLPPRGL